MKTSNRNVLISIINNSTDFAIARDQHWYRIPVKSVEKFLRHDWPPELIAFYQTGFFKNNSHSVTFYSPVIQIDRVQRNQLFPEEPLNEKSHQFYYQFFFEPLNKLTKPIISRRFRRIVFIPTTFEKFQKAIEINDLYDGSPLEDRLWAELKRLEIYAERQELVNIDYKNYFLDFALYCIKGKLDIETDGDRWHHTPVKAPYDNLRNNDLVTAGWEILRFTKNQVCEQMEKYCLPKITDKINSLGGIKKDDYFSRRIDLKSQGTIFQYNLFDI